MAIVGFRWFTSTYKVRVKVTRNTGRCAATKEIDRSSLGEIALLPIDTSAHNKLFDICCQSRGSLFARLCKVPITLPAGSSATLTFWLCLVAFHTTYPDIVRQKVPVSDRLMEVHVLASNASSLDFWPASAGASGWRRRSVGTVRAGWRYRSVLWSGYSGERQYRHFWSGRCDVSLRHSGSSSSYFAGQVRSLKPTRQHNPGIDGNQRLRDLDSWTTSFAFPHIF